MQNCPHHWTRDLFTSVSLVRFKNIAAICGSFMYRIRDGSQKYSVTLYGELTSYNIILE